MKIESKRELSALVRDDANVIRLDGGYCLDRFPRDEGNWDYWTCTRAKGHRPPHAAGCGRGIVAITWEEVNDEQATGA